MHMCLKIEICTETGNKALRDGTLAKIIQNTSERIKAEASYFTTEAGKRTGFFFFSMTDSSQIPSIVEPLFMGLNADVTFFPVMNQTELVKGLEEWKKQTL